MGTSLRENNLYIQDRDTAMLRGLFESRIMTASHVAAIHFGGRREYAKKRLQKLKTAGLISERPRRMNEPAILYLTPDGISVLSERGLLVEYPSLSETELAHRSQVSELTLRHELDILDVKAAFYDAIRAHPALTIDEFCTWPRLLAFANGTGQESRPDGFFRIHERQTFGAHLPHAFFIEVDRSTEALDILAAKASAYSAFYHTGGFAERCGAPRSAFRQYPFRVLMIFKTAKRRDNVAAHIVKRNPAILTQVWLSTMDEVRLDPLGSIWVQPVDYRTPAPSITKRRLWLS